METELYAINCNHPRKVRLAIRRGENASTIIPTQKAILIKPCPRIDGHDVQFDIEVNFGIPVSATCDFTQCHFHALNNDAGVSA